MTIEEIKEKYKHIPFPQPKHEYGGLVTEPPVEIKKWMKFYLSTKLEPLYLEEDLVPSQFFGLDDYLKYKI